jgi:hypothetical protein
MARTPLLRALHRLFAEHRAARHFQGFMEGGAEQGKRAARELAGLV